MTQSVRSGPVRYECSLRRSSIQQRSGYCCAALGAAGDVGGELGDVVAAGGADAVVEAEHVGGRDAHEPDFDAGLAEDGGGVAVDEGQDEGVGEGDEHREDDEGGECGMVAGADGEPDGEAECAEVEEDEEANDRETDPEEAGGAEGEEEQREEEADGVDGGDGPDDASLGECEFGEVDRTPGGVVDARAG